MGRNKSVSPKVYESVVIDAQIEEVWEVIRGFNAMPEWHPGIADSEIIGGSGVGSVRKLTLEGGGETKEKLLALSDVSCEYVYTIVESAMPIKNYVSTLSLSEVTATNQTFGEWYSNFDVTDLSEEEDAIGTVRDVYTSGLGNLVDRFG